MLSSPWLRTLCCFFLLFLCVGQAALHADDGYRLWLRYNELPDSPQKGEYREQFQRIRVQGRPSATLDAAADELAMGLSGLLGQKVEKTADTQPFLPGTILLISEGANGTSVDSHSDPEGFQIKRNGTTVVSARTDVGVLYGAFALLRAVQTLQPTGKIDLISKPRLQRRLLDHWDDLNGFIERVQAGRSIWNWFQLPDYVDPRYRDYARANASIGLNGAVLNNVNANALILTPQYLTKVAAIADILRIYGQRVYLTARFSAPIEIGKLKTADPLDAAVRDWWKAKADEIYARIPDFGGFLIKANSEGQPGPQDYGRTHADGANMMADVLAPHGGIVMWRAFVYSHEAPDDRAKQAYTEFKPLDGSFRPNVVVQVKNGPIDFMPREPFHPLFGAMPKTPLGLELQITQEYLGGAVHLAFLAPMWKEVLDADTGSAGAGSTVARVVNGSLEGHSLSLIAGVSNIGDTRNWTGHPLAAANWYAYGRLAWDSELTSAAVAEEWIRATFSNSPRAIEPLRRMLLESREAVVNYSMPLGLHHIMAEGHHYGVAPWAVVSRPDWSSPYYHRADEKGLGFDRTATGSNALAQYSPPARAVWENPATCPEALLLWFHHVPWDRKLTSGLPLWNELGRHYQGGVDTVREWRKTWAGLQKEIDPERFEHVAALLARQEREAVEWKDACLLYFQTFSKKPWPGEAEPPQYSLDHYKTTVRHFVPGNPSER